MEITSPSRCLLKRGKVEVGMAGYWERENKKKGGECAVVGIESSSVGDRPSLVRSLLHAERSLPIAILLLVEPGSRSIIVIWWVCGCG